MHRDRSPSAFGARHSAAPARRRLALLHHESLSANFPQRRLMNFQGARAETHQSHLLHQLVSIQKIFRLAHGNPRRTVHREAIRAGADGWERHGLDAVLDDN